MTHVHRYFVAPFQLCHLWQSYRCKATQCKRRSLNMRDIKAPGPNLQTFLLCAGRLWFHVKKLPRCQITLIWHSRLHHLACEQMQASPIIQDILLAKMASEPQSYELTKDKLY